MGTGRKETGWSGPQAAQSCGQKGTTGSCCIASRVYLSVSALSDYALRDLIGLLFRYDVPMSFLRSQITSGNEHWFKDPGTYWYEKIFGET